MRDAPSLSEDIRQEIRLHGRITFARYMELALYAPDKGYYSGSATGFGGTDYVTSPLAHPVFGALLGRQLFQIWDIIGNPDEFLVAEQGAGNGALACDILGYVERAFPKFYQCLTYLAVDCTPSPFHSDVSHHNLEYIRSYSLPKLGGVGCVISNELIDAYPVHRFKVEGGKLIEGYVHVDRQGEFVEIFDEPSTDLLGNRLEDLSIPLKEGLNGEINLHIDDWARSAAACLDTGIVLTIDYGDLAIPLYNRPWGTLQTYYSHIDAGSPLKMVGQKDITAHVDFTSLINRGAQYGLQYLGLMEQGKFLRNLGWSKFFEVVSAMRFGDEGLLLNQIGLRHLVDPIHLGALRVLIQSKNLEMRDQLWGLSSSENLEDLDEQESAAVPAMGAPHVRYPGMGYSHGEGTNWGYDRFL